MYDWNARKLKYNYKGLYSNEFIAYSCTTKITEFKSELCNEAENLNYISYSFFLIFKIFVNKTKRNIKKSYLTIKLSKVNQWFFFLNDL